MNKDEPIRVLVTAPLGVSGVTNLMIDIQKHIDRSRLNFDYLVYHDMKTACEDQVYALGSRKITASADHVRFRPFRRLVRMRIIRRLCRDNRVKLLHYNADNPADLTNIIAARLGGVKYVTLHSHNAAYGDVGRGEKLTGFLLRPLIPLFCDHLIGCSELAAGFMFPKSVLRNRKYEILPNGIELEKYAYAPAVRAEVRKRLGAEDRFIIGHVGRFFWQKNHAFLIDVFARVCREEPKAVLHLFGVGPLMEEIRQKVNAMGLAGRVVFFGNSDRMDQMLQAMDVFAMPSLHEGLPVSAIEAQAAGVPCVFSENVTREADVVGGAAFLPLGDADQWARAILALRGRERQSGADKLRAAHYDIRQTADRIFDLYTGIGEWARGRRP